MKKITILLFLLILFTITEAQKVYFIYLQSENNEQFYTRIGEKIHNSSSSGYLILSNLVDSTYGMNIGVQGSQSPEQLFSVTINKKDKGYLIKNFGEKGWGLFDLQSFSIVMQSSNNAINVVKTEKRESNPFTDLLAKAADDSTIKEKPVFVKAVEKKAEVPVQIIEKKEEIQKPIVDPVKLKVVDAKQPIIPEVKKDEIQDNRKDSLVVKAQEKKADIPEQVVEKKEEIQKLIGDSINLKVVEVKKPDSLNVIKKEELAIVSNEKKENEVIPIVETKGVEKTETPAIPVVEKKVVRNPFVDEFQKSIVVKRSESSTTEGFGITFLDVTGDGSIDTIRILIPNEKVSTVVAEVKKGDLKFLDIVSTDTTNVQVKEDQKVKVSENNKKPETIDKPIQRSNNCTQLATDDDFFKVRRNMAAEISNDNMISEAKKIFRAKCFSTEQIKNLSSLFLSEEGKYKFFDASYPFVSDREKFVLLQSELKDEYFINRFKSMLY